MTHLLLRHIAAIILWCVVAAVLVNARPTGVTLVADATSQLAPVIAVDPIAVVPPHVQQLALTRREDLSEAELNMNDLDLEYQQYQDADADDPAGGVTAEEADKEAHAEGVPVEIPGEFESS